MLKTNALVGQLNNPSARANYVGGVTDSVKITVDNSTMTIKGDVIWGDILGNTADKAYPGNLGKENYENIILLTNALNQEIKRAKASEGKLNSEIGLKADQASKDAQEALEIVNSEVARATFAETELRNILFNEINKVIASSAELLDSLNKETEIRSIADEAIQSQINDIVKNISSSTHGLDVILQEEIIRAKDAEKKLEAEISKETNRAVNRETELEALIDTKVLEVDNRISTIHDTTVASIEELVSDIEFLNKSLKEEKDRSYQIDNETSSLLDDIKKRVDSQDITLVNTNVRIDETDANIQTHEEQINTLNTKVADLFNSDENIADQISNLEIEVRNEIARSKEADSLLDSEVASINSNINNKIDPRLTTLEVNNKSIEEIIVEHKVSIDTVNDALEELRIRDNELSALLDATTGGSSEIFDELKIKDDEFANAINALQGDFNNLNNQTQLNTSLINEVSEKAFNTANQFNEFKSSTEEAISELNDVTSSMGAKVYSDIEALNKLVENNNTKATQNLDKIKSDVVILTNEVANNQTKTQTSFEDINSRVEDLNTIIEDYTKTTDSQLEDIFAELKDLNEISNQKASALQYSVETLESNVDKDLNNLRNGFANQITQLKDKDDELNTKYIESETARKNLEHEFNDRINSLNNLTNKEIHNLKNKDDELYSLINNNNEIIEKELVTLSQTVANDISTIKDRASDLEMNIQVLSNQQYSDRTTTENLIQNINNEINILDTRVERLEADIQANLDVSYSDLETSIDDLNKNLYNQVAQLRESDSQIQEEIDNRTEAIVTNIQNIDSRIDSVDDQLRNEIDRAIAKENAIENNFDSSITELANDIQRNLQIAMNANAITEEKYSNLEIKVNSYIDNNDEKVTSIIDTLPEINEELDRLSIKVDNLDVTNQIIDTITPLKESVEALDTKVTNAAANLSTIDSELTEQINSVDTKVETYKTSLSETIKGLDTQVDNLEEEVATIIPTINETLEETIKPISDKVTQLEDVIIPNSINNLKEIELKVLEGLIDTEAQNRQTEDSKLSDKIDAETIRAATAENNLQIEIEDVRDLFKGPYVKSERPKDGSMHAYVAAGSSDYLIPVTSSDNANAIVQRDEDGKITLPRVLTEDDMANFGAGDAIPRSYVDFIDRELRNYVNSVLTSVTEIKFIEGGTAPIVE